jgi:hypothetical protein
MAVTRVYNQSINFIVHHGTFDIKYLIMSQTELRGLFFAILYSNRKKIILLFLLKLFFVFKIFFIKDEWILFLIIP